jgi:hypothetical protein
MLSIQAADETADRVQLEMDAPLALGRHVDLALVIGSLDQHGICGSLDRASAMIERKVALDLLDRAQAAPFKQVFARPAFARDGAAQEVAVGHWIDSSSNGTARKSGAIHGGWILTRVPPREVRPEWGQMIRAIQTGSSVLPLTSYLGRCRSKKAQITAGPFGSLGVGPKSRG